MNLGMEKTQHPSMADTQLTVEEQVIQAKIIKTFKSTSIKRDETWHSTTGAPCLLQAIQALTNRHLSDYAGITTLAKTANDPFHFLKSLEHAGLISNDEQTTAASSAKRVLQKIEAVSADPEADMISSALWVKDKMTELLKSIKQQLDREDRTRPGSSTRLADMCSEARDPYSTPRRHSKQRSTDMRASSRNSTSSLSSTQSSPHMERFLERQRESTKESQRKEKELKEWYFLDESSEDDEEFEMIGKHELVGSVVMKDYKGRSLE